MATPRAVSSEEDLESSSPAPLKPSQSLRPLAPKPPKPRPHPPPARSRPSSSIRGIPRRLHPLACAVCSQIGCQLPTHRALIVKPGPGTSSPGDPSDTRSALVRFQDSSYSKSYAYFYAQQYVDADIAAARFDPFFELPIQDDGNLPEMHRLFHDYFTIESSRAFNIPRPPEMVTEVIHSPFFIPAMSDPALCLSILAVSAASVPTRASQSARKVTAFTLVGQAMQALRERLSSSPEYVSDSTIAAATFLWGVNSLIADPAAMRLHATSVYALVDARGGLGELGLDGAVAQLIRWIDLLNSVICAELCNYPDAVDPGPLKNPPAPSYGSFFGTARSAANLNSRVAQTCENTCRNVEFVERAAQSGIRSEDYVHMLSRIYFHGVQRSMLQAEFDGAGNMNECVCMALDLFNIFVFHMPRDQKMLMLNHTARLMRSLKRTGGPSFWMRDMDVLVWILFVAVMIPHEFEDREFCMNLLVRALTTKFEGEEWPPDWQQQVHQDLRQFVWSDVSCEAVFDSTCIAITQRVLEGEESD